MAEESELNSFVEKFKKLWKSGLYAHLDLDKKLEMHGLACALILDLHQVVFILITIDILKNLEIVQLRSVVVIGGRGGP